MAQSGHHYGVEQPKSNAHAQNHREPETTANPKPACRVAKRDEVEWRDPPFAEALSEFYPPCPDCFPDGAPDPTITERVVISRNSPSVYHRVREDRTRREQDETTSNRLFSDLVSEAGEPVVALADLRVGDGIVWNPPQIPLTVVGIAEIKLQGPAGGEYTLTEADADTDALYTIYDGYGCISELSRVTPTGNQSRSTEPERY